MSPTTADFDYPLTPNLIAQSPAAPHESARLMRLERKTGRLSHHLVADLPQFFRPGDVMVVNNTKVFHARLFGNIANYHKPVELFLIRPLSDNNWQAIANPGKKLTIGTKITITAYFQAQIIDKQPSGTLTVDFDLNQTQVIQLANLHGQIPVPPYIKKIPREDEYQTSFAKVVGSVAAPTAGFHLTANIRKQLLELRVKIIELTLHVGLGTFLPIKSATLNEHQMHSEWAELNSKTAEAINSAKTNHQRIIAVGTTTVRTLEGVAALNHGKLTGFGGDIDLFIQPGFKFQTIDGLLTNFHLPKSTLLVLVSAFAGREKILKAYREAINHKYRFYSFGDAMLII